MPRREAPLYQRGKYWLGWDRKSDGSLRTPYLTIFWHDDAGRRGRSRSTRTADREEGMIALDRLYLADRGEAPAYCHACGQAIAQGAAYLLNDAIADYRLEIGDERRSADSIAARLKHVSDFLVADGRMSTSCADAASPVFIERFRAWSGKQPVSWRNGAGKVTVTRPRSPATTEESVTQLRAVLHHAVDRRRSDSTPAYKPLGRRRVSQPRLIRCDEAVLADMLAYAAEPKQRRGSLHAFLVGSICTIARPDAVVDIATRADRRQWAPGSSVLNLNPAGRAQTEKRRAIVPLMPPLAAWLTEVAAEEAAKPEEERTGGWLVNYFGRPVLDVDRAWDTMLEKLKLPREREWRSYLIRHSVSTMVRNRGALKWELQAFMGHLAPDPTETYAVATVFPTVTSALADILEVIEKRAPAVLRRTSAGAASNVIQLRRAKMT